MRWLAILLVACGQPPAPAAPAESPGVDFPPRAPILTSPNGAGAKELVAEMVAKGMTATPGDKPGETLVCNATQSCVCMVELECPAGGCLTLAHNLDQFDRALHSDTTTVSCELADTGTLCDGSYFRFEGDIYRWETRYFDASGHAIGQRNATDDPEYCGGQASTRFIGAQPRCAKATNVKTICTDHQHDHPLRNPRALLEDELFPR
ncbi:MAG: hypothetical protein QM831_26145 [Kofleriaceae bacterium]